MITSNAPRFQAQRDQREEEWKGFHKEEVEKLQTHYETMLQNLQNQPETGYAATHLICKSMATCPAPIG